MVDDVEGLHGVDELNGLPEADALRVLLACCASTSWAAQVLAGRPYASREQLLERGERACRGLTEAELDEALSGHPRIGERLGGDDARARLSRREQAVVARADHDLLDRLRQANLDYERRFDRVFLIRAAGRRPEEILGELGRRLANDPATERSEVADQLAQITRRRLEGMVP
jgi:2-oxo-4-hydroxy-4-carboxy-5-ureidoimidazoline decarboxylase